MKGINSLGKATLSENELNGNVPDRSQAGLVLVGVINDLDFPGNGSLLRRAPQLAENIARLKGRCKAKREELIAIAKEALDHESNCELVSELKRISREKYEAVLAATKALRREYTLKLTTKKKRDGSSATHLPQPALKAIAAVS